MATTEVEDLPAVKPTPVAHVRDMAGNVWEEVLDIKDHTEEELLGQKGRPLWLVFAWVIVLACLVAPSPAAVVLGAVMALILMVRSFDG